jgi:gliding motility-associated-like protein
MITAPGYSLSKRSLQFTFSLILLFALSATKLFANCININTAFVPSQTLVCGTGPTVISFNNNSTGTGAAGADYTWYLNGVSFDNTTGLGAPNTSTISAAGTYTYMLVASDPPCKDTAIVQVIIRPLPVAAFNFAPNNQCAGTTIAFTNTSTGTGVFTTYSWNFGDASTSTAISPSHVFANGGTYNVTLTISNGTGCTSTISHTVTVLPRPAAAISGDDGDGDTQYCLSAVDNTTSELVTFFNTTTGATSYSWNFGDGSPVFNTASTASIDHTYTSYGTFTVTMVATGANGCTTTTSLSVIFDKFVSASFIVPLAQFSGCVPHTVTPQNASQNASQYVWNFGDGTPSVTTTSFVAPSHTYTVGGSFTISCVASNSCNSSTSTVGPITVVGPPVINFTASPTLGCSLQTVTFSNTTTGASPTNNFFWNFGNGNTLSGVKNPPSQVYHQGTWTIMLVAGNACGTDTTYRTIVVDTIPTAIMTAVPLDGCTPLVVATTNTSVGGNLSYQWYIDGVFTYTTATIPNQTFTAPAGNAVVNHTIRLRVSNHCGVDDTTVTIRVHPTVQAILAPLTSTICESGTVTFTQSSRGDALTYAWNFGNGNTSTSATPPIQTYSTAGTYTVTLTVTGYCGTSTATATVTVNPIPAAPTALGATICANTSTSLTATAPGPVYQWYNAAAGGTLLLTGATYTTPVLTTTTNYYVQSTALGCTSPRTIVTVTVNPIPVAPTAPGTTICSGNTATLNATAPGGTYNWYNASVGGTLLGTGPSFTTPVLTSTTTYYVASTILGCTGPRTTVTVTVTPIPAAPTAANVSICTGNTATVTATAPGGTYQWYDASTGGTLLSTGASYTTPVLTATTVYYVQTTVSGCTSPRTAVTVTVNPIPVADIVPDVNGGCAGLVVHFNNNSTLGGTYNWSFAGATPTSSTAYSPPAITFNTSGNNMVYLTVNVSGCIQRDTVFINITPLPTPAFTTTPATGCSPVTTAIANTSGVVLGDTYLWSFSNGTTSTLQNPPSQTYTATGIDSSYVIKLIVSAANGCRDSVSHTITVHANPVAAFTPDNDTICANGSVLFSNGTTGATSYQWSFGDLGTSTATSPSHIYTTPNTYTVQVIASTAFACKDTALATIVVDSIPTAAFSASTECLGFATQFTNTSSGSIVSWNWNFGDGSPAGTTISPSHTYPANGTYNVTLTVTNVYGCSKSITHPVIVNPVPVAAFTNNTACFGTATVFTDQTTGTPINWIWNFGDATPTNNSQNPSHTFSAAGNYIVTLIAFGGSGCSDTITHTITVNPVPTANFTFASVCTNDTMFFSSTSTGGPTTFVWNFGDGFISNTNNPSPTHVYTTTGTYNVTLTAGYATGCTNSITIPVTAYPLTVPGFTSTTPCLNIATSFTDATTNSPNQWTWNFGDGSGISTAQSPTHTYAAPGTYPVKLITQNSFGCKDSITINTVVNPLPVAAFIFDTVCKGTATAFTNQSVSSVSWNWNFGDATAASTANSPTHVYAASGTYTVTLISSTNFGCTDTITHSIIVNPNPVAAYSATTACYTYATTFTDNSTSAISWSWNFGDGSSLVSTTSPTYFYPAAGTYNASLTVTNVFGCTNSVTHPVLVNPIPTAAFINSTVCFGQATSFTDQTTGTPIGWIWDFGDGTAVNNSQNPSHNFAAAGTYDVTLIASGGSGCADTIINTITVNPVPTANFSFVSVCTNDTMFFSSTSLGAPDTFSWNFGDGFSDNTNDPSPTHVYTTAGTYNVTLAAGYSSTGCTNSITLTVIAYPLTVPDFTSSTPCLNVATAFTDATTNTPTQWSWNYGDGTGFGNTQNPSHVYGSPGTYPVTLVTQNVFGCKDSVTINTTVNPLPIAAFAFDTVCANSSTTFTDQSTSAVSWAWDFGDGAVSSSNSPTHIYPASGTYNVTLIVANIFGCTDTISHSIIVNPNPVSNYSATTACHTYATVFTDNSTAAVQWNWNFGDATANGTIQSPSHIYANPGNYNVDLLVTNIFGCTNSSSQTIIVLPQPQADFSFSTVCARQSVQFTDMTVGAAMTNWSWNFGDGGIAAVQNPTHIYALGGNYNVTLIVSNTAGCQDTIVRPIIVNTVPAPLFSANDGCLGTTTSFTDLSTDAVTINSWLWDFNDGNNSFSQNPDYVYLNAGTYNVSLTVTNVNGCDSTIVMPVNINPLPTAAFTVTPVCQGIASAFNDLSSGSPTQWTWDFGDGSPLSNIQNPTHVYTTNGVFVAKLIVANAFGCTDSLEINVTVKPKPTAAFVFDTVCSGNATSFVDQSISTASWSWNFGDGSPLNSVNSPTHIYAGSGTYNVILIAANVSGCTDTVTHSIIVNPNPISSFIADTACFTDPTLFTDNSTSAVSWSWNFGDGSALDTNQSPTHTYALTGNFTVSLTVSSGFGCTNSSSQVITVLPQPVADFTNSALLCEQQTIQFTDASTGASIISWSWDFGDASALSSLQNPTHIYTAAGSYDVALTAFNSSGCSDKIIKTIVVHSTPTPAFTSTAGCLGDATVFSDQSTDVVAINNWFYDFNDGNNSTSQNPSYTYSAAGTYNVSLMVTNVDGCINTIIQPVTINVLPSAAFTVNSACLGDASVFTDGSSGSPTQWTWDFGDGSSVSNLQNPSHTYATDGVFIAKLIAANSFGCTDSIEINVIVKPKPTAAFTFDTACNNSITSFIDQSLSAVNWSWDFGDGSALTSGNSPTHLYPANGTYTATLIAANVNGCSDTVSHSIIVNPNPVSSFTATSSCFTSPTLFTDNSSSASGWSWNFGDGSAVDTNQSPTHVFALTGNYDVTLTVTSGFGCTNSSTQTITVLPQPVADFTNSSLCAQQAVQFTDATAGPSVNNWSWNFDDGSALNSLQNPSHTFALAGTYNVALIVSNSSGCVNTIIKPVVVNTTPNPLFTATTSCEGTVTSFTDQSTDAVAINNWFYDFADGNNSTSQNPNYIYANAGTYNVSLTVTNVNGCSDTFILPVNINVHPVANYIVDTVCIGTATTFTDLSTGSPTSWQWNFGDGNNGITGPVVTHVYSTAGTYVTSLTVSSGAGCSDQTFRIVVVRSDIQAHITSPVSACVGSLVTLNDNSVITTGFILSDTWDFGDGSPIANTLNTTHTYTTAGTYTITHVVVSDGGCMSTAVTTIIINPLPVANFTTNNICTSQQAQFTDISTGPPVSWSWNFGDFGTSTDQNPVHFYVASGSFNVNLTVTTAAGCTDNTVLPITVYFKPVASFTSSVECWGDTTLFVNTSTSISGTISGYWWDFHDGTTSTLANPNHLFTSHTNSFPVTFAVITNLGCVDTINTNVTTHPLPVFNYDPDKASGCDAFTVNFYDTTAVAGGNIVNWLWDFGDGNYSFTQYPTHTYDEPGNYNASLTVTDWLGCKMTDTLNYPIVVYPTPVPGFSASPNETSIYEPGIQFNDESIGGTYWEWDLGDFETSIDENPYHIYPDTGTYLIKQIVISNIGGCKDSVTHPVRINGESTIFIPNAFTPDENGLNDVFAPKFFGMLEFKMIIFDRWGNQIFETEDMNEGWNGKVNGQGEVVQQDVYVYKIFTKDILKNNHRYMGRVTVVK